MESQAVTNFREYLRVESVQPNPDYRGCIQVLRRLYGDLGLTISEMDVAKGKPVLVFTRSGTDPSLPSILLNSHMDVVPVTESKWTYKPFSGHKEDGKIFGRGSQDTKCIGIQALEALRKHRNAALLRTVHVSFVPDEEIGGAEGMAAWVKTEHFKKLNIGFALDEGCLLPLPIYILFFTERTMWSVEVTVKGQSGHGSLFHTNTAAEKLTKLLNKAEEFRKTEEDKYKANMLKDWPNIATSLNLTMIHGGTHHNVLPDEIKVSFDCRLAPTLNFDEFKDWFKKICEESGEGVTVDFIKQDPKCLESPIDDSNPFWAAFSKTTEKMGLTVMPITCPGTTDARYLRQVGIPAYGFTPMNNTPTLLHDHDEFVYEEEFIKGIEIFEGLIEALASVPATQ